MFQENNAYLSSAKYFFISVVHLKSTRYFFVRYTATLLIVFAILLTSKQYYGEPIDCWCPAHFTDSHVSFTNAVCWASTFLHLCLFLNTFFR